MRQSFFHRAERLYLLLDVGDFRFRPLLHVGSSTTGTDFKGEKFLDFLKRESQLPALA